MPGRCSSDWAGAVARAPFEVTCADCRSFLDPAAQAPGPFSFGRRGGGRNVGCQPVQAAAPTCNAKHRGWSCTFPVRKPVKRSPAQAGFTSPAARLSAAISRSESPLTTAISRSLSSVSPKCCLVASMALNGAAMATLKYRNDGGPKPRRPTQRDRASSDGSAGIVSCTTQPAGDALSVMHRDLGYIAPPSQATSRSKRARTAAGGLFLLIRRPE